MSHLSKVIENVSDAIQVITPHKRDFKACVAYRGEYGVSTNGKAFHSRYGAISFGSIEAAYFYAKNKNNKDDIICNPKLIKAELSFYDLVINTPSDPFIEGESLINAFGIEKAIVILKRLSAHVFQTDNWGDIARKYNIENMNAESALTLLCEKYSYDFVSQIYVDAYPVFNDKEFVIWFKEKGYDGAIHAGNGVTAMEIEYKVFNEKQAVIIKSVDLDLDLDDNGNLKFLI
jgi:hypothetical protein